MTYGILCKLKLIKYLKNLNFFFCFLLPTLLLLLILVCLFLLPVLVRFLFSYIHVPDSHTLRTVTTSRTVKHLLPQHGYGADCDSATTSNGGPLIFFCIICDLKHKGCL